MIDRYSWRPDGNFLIKETCSCCGLSYDVSAMSQWSPEHICGACKYVNEKAAKLRHDEQRRIDELDRASGVQDYEE